MKRLFTAYLLLLFLVAFASGQGLDAWRPSVAYNFPRGFVTFTIDKNGRTDELKIDQPNNDFWFYESHPKRVK